MHHLADMKRSSDSKVSKGTDGIIIHHLKDSFNDFTLLRQFSLLLLLITMEEGEKGIREAIRIRRFHMPLEQEGRTGSPTITFCCATNKDDNNF